MVVNSSLLIVFLLSMATVHTINGEDISDNLVSQNVKDLRVAVIGSGIGGASATHFLRKSLGETVQIDVFEKSDHIGGRLHIVTIDGQSIESGGTIIHSSNKYTVDFVKDLGLGTNVAMSNERLGIYNGKEFVFVETSTSWWNGIKMIWRYGFFSLKNMSDALSKMLTDFVSVYQIQDEGKAFKTVPDLLKALGGDYFVECTDKTSRQIMKEKGVGDELINELLTAVSRNNYGQSTDEINGFTGYVSLAGAQGGSLWNVEGGNYHVPQRLLQKSKAEVHINTKITSIKKHIDESSGKIAYYLEGAGNETPYDAVIVAAPLEIPSYFITCAECKDWPKQSDMGRYQQTIANFIHKPVDYKYFGYKSAEKLPDIIFTTEEESLNFTTIEPHGNVNGDPIKPPVYKVFSRKPMTSEMINQLFITGSQTPEYTSVNWLAYPHYSPPEKFLPFELDEGVFYVNAIERAASAMEMSAIGGRNAALLAVNYLESQKQSQRAHS
ncbi:prenylcysteine oxidase 1-like isoform X2 [Clytia hemisphaerica]|uniref:Prenylcysteine lyase domain-containing protein n=1 Tax=Clytia hemisphaerica TaxID=252671 RepID=A0A7M5UHP5_9CNID